MIYLYAFIAQLVEQRTENPCVPGSIPGEGTKFNNLRTINVCELFVYKNNRYFIHNLDPEKDYKYY